MLKPRLRILPPRLPLRVLAMAMMVSLAGCGAGDPDVEVQERPDTTTLGEPDLRVPDPPVEAQALLASVEESLLEENGVVLPFQVEAEGGLEVELEGILHLAPGARVRLEATGQFGGEQADVLLISDGGQMYWRSNGEEQRGDTPPALREGVVLGLTRMGILHNLARLVAGSPPEATEGSARTWVRTTEPSHAGSEPSVPTAVAVHFRIVVGGEAAGEATLWLDGGTLVPLLRRQTVLFPGGEMRVTERYVDPAADVELPDSLFVLPTP